MKQNSRKFYGSLGFTIIELLIVIAVIGILTSGIILLINPLGQIKKANDAKRKSDLAQMQKALEQYYTDNGKYPTNTAGYQVTGVAWGSAWGNYMQILPKDPSATKKYVYVTNGTQQSYWLYAGLEYAKDPQQCNNGNACVNATANSVGAACGGTCTYGVSSSNTTP